MAWDSVPWFVGGQAKHSAGVSRLLAHVAAGGREGIIGPTDLEVRELAVPGTKVRVFPGACAIINRALNVKYEMYLGRNLAAEDVAIAPTSASGGRSDLIVARVENPYLNGEPWPEPTTPEEAAAQQYIRTAVIPGVPAGTKTVKQLNLGYSAIPLGRIDLPASTGTVLQSYIKDLRFMADVASDTEQFIIQQAGGDTLGETVMTVWPYSLQQQVQVPEWATQANVHVTVAGAFYGPGNARGDIRVDVGGQKTQVTVFDVASSELSRADVHAGGSVGIPAALRGSTINVFAEARSYTAGITTHLVSDANTTAIMTIQWRAVPASNF
jgi:hypothetical protein